MNLQMKMLQLLIGVKVVAYTRSDGGKGMSLISNYWYSNPVSVEITRIETNTEDCENTCYKHTLFDIYCIFDGIEYCFKDYEFADLTNISTEDKND